MAGSLANPILGRAKEGKGLLQLLNSIGWSLIAFTFVLGVMIFVHELGHYLMAKYLGIRVEVFSLGFGPRLLGFRRGGTDYRISALPLGGYVKMTGENYDEQLTGSPEEFMSRPKTHRFLVAVAGPVMNLGLALVLLAANFMMGVEVAAYLSKPAVVGKVDTGSPAERGGIQYQDKIVEINGEPTPAWQDVQFAIGTNPEDTLTITIEREGQTLTKRLEVTSAPQTEVGTIGIDPYIPYLIGKVDQGTPADEAGLRPGDQILEVRSPTRTAYGYYDIPELISSQKNQPLLFRVRRGDREFEKTIKPVQINDRVRIGIMVELPYVTEKYGFIDSLERSLQRNYQLTLLTFDILGKIITGRASVRVMSGPIEIARYSGVAAAGGLIPLMGFMAIISLQLGIFNLLPIPILDGGVIALLALEGLIRRDLSLAVKERIAQVGFLFLILLMGIVIFNDLSKNLLLP
ncbi:MAG: RIP metalloprotease RseP [Acidobacteria bacterium]|nr:RIP metalloprotease RseP [Acidobacteriota bacterium]